MFCSPKCKKITVFFGDDILLESTELMGVKSAVFIEGGSVRSDAIEVNFVGGVATISDYPAMLNENNNYKISVENECFLLEFLAINKTVEC
jgi:hypothetical protein